MHTGIQAYRHTGIQAHKHTSTQAYRHTGLQAHSHTLPYLINVHGRLLFSEKISRVDALIRWWTLINFLAKFQGGRLFYGGRLLILITNSRVDAYSNVDAY